MSSFREIQMQCEQAAAGPLTSSTEMCAKQTKQAPRPGYNEMAQQQAMHVVGRQHDVLEDELIRAREVGQSEGRNEKHIENVQLTKMVEHLQHRLVHMVSPLFFLVDPECGTLRAQLKKAEGREAELDRRINQQFNIIQTHEKTIAGLRAQLAEKETVNCAYIQHLEKAINKLKCEAEDRAYALNHTILSKRTVQVVRPTLLGFDVLDITRCDQTAAGLRITVAR